MSNILVHEFYPKGNHGRANLKIVLPPTQSDEATLTLRTNAITFDGCSPAGFSSEIELFLSCQGLEDLMSFCKRSLNKGALRRYLVKVSV